MILFYICKRFKSSDVKDKAAVIRKFHHENLLLFGKLLESATVRRKGLRKAKSNFEKTNIGSVSLVEEALPESNRKKSISTKDVTQKKSVLEKFSSKSNRSDTPSCAPRALPNKSIPEPTNDSQISFPFLNPSKEKYIVSNNSEKKCIGKLLNYHSDCVSVSEILSKSMSTQSEANLERWKTRMTSELGEEGFQTFNKNQMLLGSSFRKYILEYLKGVPEDNLKISDELKNYWSSAKAVFPVFKNIVDSEGLVAHTDLKYKGVFDCLAVFRNEVTLVSWKKSEKYVPTLDRTFDVPLQIAAYMGALNFDNRYPFRVEQALLVMAYNDGSKADLFHLNEERCAFYWKQWLKRYDTYRKRVEEDGVHKKEKVESKLQVFTTYKTESPKIDVCNELEKIASEIQFSPHIVKELEEEEKEEEDEEDVQNFALLHPLVNAQRLDYDPAKKISIEPSIEYEKNVYPSVSSILSQTKSEASKYILDQWRRSMIEKIGLEAFEKYEKETLEAGSTLHEYIRMRFAEGLGDNVEIPKNIEGFWRSVSSVFPLIGNVQATESRVVHPACKYRGIIDCIGFYQNKLMLIDWKTSEKTKTCVSKTYDAPLQVAAYMGAVNFDPSYPFKVEEGLIVVVYNDGTEANVLHLNKEKCLKYWKKWLRRLNKYHTMAYENGKVHYCIEVCKIRYTEYIEE